MPKNRRYSVEFKKEAARLMVIEGRPTAELAEELGIQRNLLYRWKSEHVESLELEAKPGQSSPKASCGRWFSITSSRSTIASASTLA